MASSLTKTVGNFSSAIASVANHGLGSFTFSTGGGGGPITTDFAAAVAVRVGYTSASAPTAPVQVAIQGSMESSGDDKWVNITAFIGTQVAGVTNTLASSGNGSGVSALTATGNSNLADFTPTFIYNSGTPANSEFHRTGYGATGGTTINITENTINSQNSSVLYQPAEEFVSQIDLTPWTRIRVLVYNPSGATAYWDCYVNTGDSIG
jgi:hypothetical protein